MTTTGTQPSSDYILRLYIKNTELANFNATYGVNLTKSDLDIIHKSTGSGCSFAGYSDALGRILKTNVVATNHADGFYLEFRLNHFTLFSAASNSVLPVELLDFNGKNTEGGNLLTWQTATEKDNARFVVERSPNGQLFTEIGTIKGFGTTQQKQFYSFVDNKPYPNINYYRLRQEDVDGKTTYSKIISLSTNNNSVIKIYPSVTRDYVTIEGANAIEIMNTAGQTVLSQKTNERSDIDISHLATGLFIVKAQNTEGGIFSEKIIKQ